jgi:DnaJ-class molecular chaperone
VTKRAMIPAEDHYATLGVTRDADFIAIRAAYRTLAKSYHPDASKEPKEIAEALFREINEAYETLSDSQRRVAYNLFLDKRAAAEILRSTEAGYFFRRPTEPNNHTGRRHDTRHQRKPRRNRRRWAAAVRKAIRSATDAIIVMLILGFLLLGAISWLVLFLIEIVMGVAGD